MFACMNPKIASMEGFRHKYRNLKDIPRQKISFHLSRYTSIAFISMEIESKLKIIHLAKLLPLQKKSVKGKKGFLLAYALSVGAHLGAFRLVLTFATLTKLQFLGGASKAVAIAVYKIQ